MSYATSLAHLDASTGLFASAVPGLVYALFGTCRQLNVGPEAALSLLIGQTISSLLPPDQRPHEGKGKILAEAISTIVVFQVSIYPLFLISNITRVELNDTFPLSCLLGRLDILRTRSLTTWLLGCCAQPCFVTWIHHRSGKYTFTFISFVSLLLNCLINTPILQFITRR